MKHHSKVLIGVLTLFLVIVAAGGGYLYYNYQSSQKELQKLKEGPQAEAKQEITEVKAKISELMELPTSEEPTLATVTDINKLKNQQFFSKAVNGDKVLIYTKSSKAILYRPETNKIIEVASVNLGDTQAVAPSQTPSVSGTTPRLKVAIYNGTTVKGATQTTQETLRDQVSNVEVVARENAKKTNYTKTVVVDISGKQNAAATQLSKVLGASVGPLPKGEIAPKDADLLVILGK